MKPYYRDEQVTLHLGDSLDVLPTLPDASVDAVVCDPPYELNFMGRAWDASGIAYNLEVWRQCLRVLKPGGHLLAFGGTRTYHRMTVAIEDAGFEIRDSLHWIYGSGFPKGQDIAKGIDRRRNDRADGLKVTAYLAAARDAAGWTNKQINALFSFTDMATRWTTQGKAPCVPTTGQWETLRAALQLDDPDINELVQQLNSRKGDLGEAWVDAEVRGEHKGVLPGVTGERFTAHDTLIRSANSDAARQWRGWNTVLKPAHEPIVLARKSTGFNTTVANVLEHGTGTLNIDGCRTAAGQDYRDKCASVVGLDSNRNGDAYGEWGGVREDSAHAAGRWPTNVVLSHPPLLSADGQPVGDACADGCIPGCPVADMDAQTAGMRASKPSKSGSAGRQRDGVYGGGKSLPRDYVPISRDDEGGASRFFPVFRYEAKAPASERPRLADGTAHPTVKPLALMQWLVRLVTPPGGLVLDPFAGTGSTLEAAALEDMRAIGVEQHEPYAELCRSRLNKPRALGLFAEPA